MDELQIKTLAVKWDLMLICFIQTVVMLLLFKKKNLMLFSSGYCFKVTVYLWMLLLLPDYSGVMFTVQWMCLPAQLDKTDKTDKSVHLF